MDSQCCELRAPSVLKSLPPKSHQKGTQTCQYLEGNTQATEKKDSPGKNTGAGKFPMFKKKKKRKYKLKEE